MFEGDEVRVRCLQGWKGTVACCRDATISQFLEALNAAADLRDGDCLSMIVKGKRFNPADVSATPIAELGIVEGTAVMLVLRSPEQRAAFKLQEERRRKLQEVERAAQALSSRAGLDSMVGGGYELSITNQDGTEVALDPTDRKAFTLAGLLHAKATESLQRSSTATVAAIRAQNSSDVGERCQQQLEANALVQSLDDAVHVLDQAAAAFDLLSPKYHTLGDNVALMHLDHVWASLLQQLLLARLVALSALAGGSTDSTNSVDGTGSAGSTGSAGHVSAPFGSSPGFATADAIRVAAAHLDQAKGLLRQLHG